VDAQRTSVEARLHCLPLRTVQLGVRGFKRVVLPHMNSTRGGPPPALVTSPAGTAPSL